ncbi:hypothetical protein [Paenibacillus sp. IHBB 3054]|uniref:hypothetical protein n=1 Tax=Paenibacillus sp. IHBB 3054 TaxID=3425689 RepID=UPI003F666522
MSQQTVEISPIICKIWGDRRPDSDYEGYCHHLGFDWSNFETDLDTFIEKLRGLYPIIGPVVVKDIAVQLTWRVLEGKEAEASFLQAVFGEVGVNRQKE